MDVWTWILLTIWLGTEFWISLREWGKTDTSLDRHSKKVFALCAAAAICMGLLGPRPPQFTIYYSRGIVTVLGSLIMFSGILVRVFAVLSLGKYFRTTVMVQKGQKLVTTGLYKYIRHPSYSGTLITVLGFGTVLDNWFTVCAMLVVMCIGIAHRVRVEEDVLERNFGTEFLAYKKRTKKLIPFVY